MAARFGSRLPVYAALGANILIAVTKLAVVAFTETEIMLT